MQGGVTDSPDLTVIPIYRDDGHVPLNIQGHRGSKLIFSNTLESALAQPKITLGGKHVHKTLFDKAAAYGFHICKNHPFVDGNKRVAFVLMDIFPQKNGWEIVADEEEAYAMMMSLVSGKLNKKELAAWVKGHTSKL